MPRRVVGAEHAASAHSALPVAAPGQPATVLARGPAPGNWRNAPARAARLDRSRASRGSTVTPAARALRRGGGRRERERRRRGGWSGGSAQRGAAWSRRRREAAARRTPAPVRATSLFLVGFDQQPVGIARRDVAAEGPEVAGLDRVAQRAGDHFALGVAGTAAMSASKRTVTTATPRSSVASAITACSIATSRLSSLRPSLCAARPPPRKSHGHGRRHAPHRLEIALPERFEDHAVGRLGAFEEAGDVERRVGGEDRAHARAGGRQIGQVAGVLRRRRHARGCAGAARPARRGRPASGSAAAHGRCVRRARCKGAAR